MTMRNRNRCGGFTLVELLIVVLILGILAAIVVPKFVYGTSDAEAATLQSTLNTVRQQITHQRAVNNTWPASIDPSWIVGNELKHPQNSVQEPPVQVVNASGVVHPGSKVLKSGVGGAFWYNVANGAFRARVTDLGTEAETLDFYNRVNFSNELSLGNY